MSARRDRATKTRISIVIIAIALLAAGALAGAAEQLPARMYLAELRADRSSITETPPTPTIRPTRTPHPTATTTPVIFVETPTATP